MSPPSLAHHLHPPPPPSPPHARLLLHCPPQFPSPSRAPVSWGLLIKSQPADGCFHPTFSRPASPPRPPPPPVSHNSPVVDSPASAGPSALCESIWCFALFFFVFLPGIRKQMVRCLSPCGGRALQSAASSKTCLAAEDSFFFFFSLLFLFCTRQMLNASSHLHSASLWIF